VSSLPDAERDACDVVQALAGLAALLAQPIPGGPHAADRGPALDDKALDEARRGLLHLAEDGGAAAQRVLAYLRSLRGAGDGEAVAVPPRLGEWRDWVPPRGMLFGGLGTSRCIGELPRPRRFDPGE
jgi:hypothetical protein